MPDLARPIERWVLHVDLDQFLAAVEVLRRPELAGQPVVVGGDGDPTKRGVVSTASYEARQHGVGSGMPLRVAARKCPDAIFLPVDRPAYDEASAEVMGTLRSLEWGGRPVVVEVLGWDEAFVAAGPRPGDEATARTGFIGRGRPWGDASADPEAGDESSVTVVEAGQGSLPPSGKGAPGGPSRGAPTPPPAGATDAADAAEPTDAADAADPPHASHVASPAAAAAPAAKTSTANKIAEPQEQPTVVNEEPQDPLTFATHIRDEVLSRTGLHCSVGIGDNKLRAKIATEFGKPRGSFVLTQENWFDVMGHRETTAIWGIGKKTAKKLQALGIDTVQQLAESDARVLAAELGPTMGPWYHRIGRGVSDSAVTAEPWVPRAHGRETTFQEDLDDWDRIAEETRKLTREAKQDIDADGRKAARVGLKIRFKPFITLSRSLTLPEPTNDARTLEDAAVSLLDRVERDRQVRLLGVRLEMVPPEGGY